MQRTGIILIASSLAAAVALPASAGDFMIERDSFENRIVREARRDHARSVGGYNDPITALRNLFAGELTEKDIAPGINTVIFAPKYQALQGDTVPGADQVAK